MKLSQLLKSTRRNIEEQVSNTDVQKLTSHGYEIIDQIEIANYNVVLISMPDVLTDMIGIRYQIGFSKTGTDFTDHSQHDKKFVSPNEKFPLGALSKGFPQIRKWISQYGELAVASSNHKKLQIYDKLFTRAKFSVRKMSKMGHDWIVIS